MTPRRLLLYGSAEIAERLGVSRQRAQTIMQKAGFPRPVETLACGRIWRAPDVDEWIRRHELAARLRDPLLAWTAQDGRPGVTIWQRHDAAAVASSNLAHRDRLAVLGTASAVTALLHEILPDLGPTYRPIGDLHLIADIITRHPGLAPGPRCTWMELAHPLPPPPAGPDSPRWLNQPDEHVAALLSEAYPDSYAWPGQPGVTRWAGIHHNGRLVAAAADAWSTHSVGYLAGLATHPEHRRKHLATHLCQFITADLMTTRGRAALFTAPGSHAETLYRRLGFRPRALASAIQHNTTPP